MSTTTLDTVTDNRTAMYTINAAGGYFYITRNGVYLTNKFGNARTFITRNAARKRISRERRGNFHA